MSKLLGKDAPCRNCQKREIGCHASCREYLEWHEYISKAMRFESRFTESDGYLIENRLDRANRMQRGSMKFVRLSNRMGR